MILFTLVTSIVLAVERVDNVVVSEKWDKEWGNTASRVDIVDERELEEAVSLQDGFKRIPGVQVLQNGGPGQRAGIFIRSGPSDSSLVLFDGIEINDPSEVGRGFDWSLFPIDLFSSIEILKGSQGTLYGADALSGVVRLNLPENQNRIRLRAGGRNEKKIMASLNRNGVQFFGQGVKGDGISAFSEDRGGSEQDRYESVSVGLKKTVEYNDQLTGEFLGLFNSMKSEFDNYGSDRIENDLSTRDQSVLSAKAKWKKNVSLQVFQHEVQREIDGVEFKGKSVGAKTEAKTEGSWGRLISGFDWSLESASFNAFDKKERNKYSIFTLYEKNWSDFIIGAGPRLEKNDAIEILTHRLYAQWKFARLSWSTGYRPPSLYQLYDSSAGNDQLKEVRSQQLELSLAKKGDFYKGELSFFNIKYTNQITYLGNYPNGRYQNDGEGVGKGIEFSGLIFGDWGEFGHHLSISDYYRSSDRARATGRSFFVSGLWAEWALTSELGLGVDFNYYGEREDFDYTRLPPYSIMGLKLRWEKDSYSWLINVENILNKSYELSRTYGSPGRQFYLEGQWQI